MIGAEAAMLIGFIGDMHGRAFHALAAIVTLQEQLGRQFDLVIQVGDFGYPDTTRADEPTERYLEVDPSERELEFLMKADEGRASELGRIRQSLGCSILFVRGNHEDFDWLTKLAADPTSGTAPVDPFDLFHYVPDGSILDRNGLRIAFVGGVEELPGQASINLTAYESVAEGDRFDLLITHEGPYGSSTGFHGDTHGSRLMTALVECAEPSFHVFGHAHQVFGPTTAGRTRMLGLDALVPSRLWHPEARGLKRGCLGVLDTYTGELQAVTDEWLGEFPTPFDFDEWAETELPSG
jgi:Icc-related predicted phosphoesterase